MVSIIGNTARNFIFLFPLLVCDCLQTQTHIGREKSNKLAHTWLVERSRSRGLRTRQIDRSLIQNEEMVFSRRLMNSLFFVMLRFLLLCFQAPVNFMSTLALPSRTFFIHFSNPIPFIFYFL